MANENLRASLLEVLIYSVIGIGGIIGYYASLKWLYYCCALLLCIVLVFNIANSLVQKNVYPFMITCMVVAYEFSGGLIDSILLGVSFYYATGWLFALILSVVPDIVLFIVAAITGLVFFFLRNSVVAMPLGVFCLIPIVIAAFSGKMTNDSYWILVTSLLMAILMKYHLGVVGGKLFEYSWLLTCSGCLFYPLTAIYILVYKAVRGHCPKYHKLEDFRPD